jgi:hypothetical protein
MCTARATGLGGVWIRHFVTPRSVAAAKNARLEDGTIAAAVCLPLCQEQQALERPQFQSLFESDAQAVFRISHENSKMRRKAAPRGQSPNCPANPSANA